MKKKLDMFHVRFKLLFASLGKSQGSFARQLGITPGAMSQILSGKRHPSTSVLQKICKLTGASADYLLGLK